MWDVWLSIFHGPTLAAADEIGLFPRLEAAPATALEIADEMALDARAAEALLGVLAALGFLAVMEGRFNITEVSRNFLLPGRPYYWGAFLHRYRQIPLSCAALLAALKQGKPGAPDGATNLFQRPDAEKLRRFTEAMHAHSFAAAMALASRRELTGVRRLLDVGGGSGAFCLAFGMRHPELRCTVMDLPLVCDVAKRYIVDHGMEDRIDVHAADMFGPPWPTSYDAIFFSEIFHDWSQERCADLARRSFAALPPGGRIYLHEMLLSDTKDGPLPVSTYSIAMIFSTLGKQLTAGELTELLRGAGFAEISVKSAYGYHSLVSGKKP